VKDGGNRGDADIGGSHDFAEQIHLLSSMAQNEAGTGGSTSGHLPALQVMAMKAKTQSRSVLYVYVIRYNSLFYDLRQAAYPPANYSSISALSDICVWDNS
jgi:hypothetical protein